MMTAQMAQYAAMFGDTAVEGGSRRGSNPIALISDDAFSRDGGDLIRPPSRVA